MVGSHILNDCKQQVPSRLDRPGFIAVPQVNFPLPEGYLVGLS